MDKRAPVIPEDLDDLGDQLHAVVRDVVEAADEGRHEGGAGLGREQRLGRREAQGDVDLNAFAGERPARLQTVPDQRQLDADVGGELGEPAALGQHAIVGRGGDLRADRAIDQGADLLDHLEEAAPGLGDQRRIGGHAIEQAAGGQLRDLRDVGGIDEEFHGCPIPLGGPSSLQVYHFVRPGDTVETRHPDRRRIRLAKREEDDGTGW